jgi:hypothetical protein
VFRDLNVALQSDLVLQFLIRFSLFSQPIKGLVIVLYGLKEKGKCGFSIQVSSLREGHPLRDAQAGRWHRYLNCSALPGHQDVTIQIYVHAVHSDASAARNPLDTG